MLIPVFKQVAIVPVKANTSGDYFIGIHGITYIPNIYNMSTEKLKRPRGKEILKKISINYFRSKACIFPEITNSSRTGRHVRLKYSEQMAVNLRMFQPELGELPLPIFAAMSSN